MDVALYPRRKGTSSTSRGKPKNLYIFNVLCITENKLEIHLFVKYSCILSQTGTGKLNFINLVHDFDNFPFKK
jgi:hypothetical protein